MLYDLHTHSMYSDGAAPPGEMIKKAISIGLNGMAITDHNEVKGALEALKIAPAGFRVIPGIEVSSAAGHILGLGITQIIPRDLSASETVKRIHDAGGIAIAAHPFDRIRQGVGDLVYSVDFDAVEVYNGHTMVSSRNHKDILKNLRVPAVGGSDAHLLSEIGSVVMDLEGDPLEAIVKGQGRVSVNISKTRILYNHLKRRLAKRSV
ncbi:MAG: CehA/McbA family metallohydrolase [Candidatus Altiarchaeia archaeon]